MTAKHMTEQKLKKRIAKLCCQGCRDCNYDCDNCKELNSIVQLIKDSGFKE